MNTQANNTYRGRYTIPHTPTRYIQRKRHNTTQTNEIHTEEETQYLTQTNK